MIMNKQKEREREKSEIATKDVRNKFKVMWYFVPWLVKLIMTGWEAFKTSFKRSEQAALSYVEQTVNVHIVLFYVWPQMFYC